MPEKMTVRPKFILVKLDETKHWRDDIAAKAGKIHGIYLYDENLQTRTCDIRPSYWLEHMYNIAENYPEDEEELNKFDEILMNYGGDDPSGYYYTSSIDSISDKNKYICKTFEELIEEDYQCLVSEAIDYYKANRMF